MKSKKQAMFETELLRAMSHGGVSISMLPFMTRRAMILINLFDHLGQLDRIVFPDGTIGLKLRTGVSPDQNERS